jgi:hypothetical protein
MTRLQKMREVILCIEIRLYRKQLEFARALKEHHIAQHYKQKTHATLTKLREFRESVKTYDQQPNN